MDKKSYIIVGIGNFGLSVVRTLAQTNVDVLVIDRNAEKLEAVSGMVAEAVCADAQDPEVLNALGVKNFDGAIITVGKSLDTRVLVTMQLKEMGVPYVMVKALSDVEGRVLTKVGADKVVFPEREMGIHVGNSIARGNLFDTIELNEDHSIVDFNVPKKWIGRTLKEVDVRQKYKVSIIGIRRGQELMVNPRPDEAMNESDILVILGKNIYIDDMLDNDTLK